MTDSTIRKQINELVRQAQRAGDVHAARELLKKALELDPSSEKANLWMATVSDDKDQREYYIQRVLEINPKNRVAPYLRRVATPEERQQSQLKRSKGRSPDYRFSRLMLVFGVISMLFMGFMIFKRVTLYQEDTYLAKNGSRAVATITDRTTLADNEYEIYRLWFSYEAQTDAGVSVVDDVYNDVPQVVYDAVQIGDTFEVLYLNEELKDAKLPFVLNEANLKSAFTRELGVMIVSGSFPLLIGGIAWFVENSRAKKRKEQSTEG